jgi:hypothetical protein
MMYVESLKLLHTLHAQRERERSESIETDDDAAAIDDHAFRTLPFNEHPAHSRAGYERDTKQLFAEIKRIPAPQIVQRPSRHC